MSKKENIIEILEESIVILEEKLIGLTNEKRELLNAVAIEKKKKDELFVSKFTNPCEYYNDCPYSNATCLRNTNIRKNCDRKKGYDSKTIEALKAEMNKPGFNKQGLKVEKAIDISIKDRLVERIKRLYNIAK